MNTETIKLSSIRPMPGGGARPSAAPAPAAADASTAVARAIDSATQAQAARAQQSAAEAAAEANRRLAEKGSELTIEFDDALDRMIFRLVDAQTGEVVRQIPSEEVLAIARALADNASAGVMLRADA